MFFVVFPEAFALKEYYKTTNQILFEHFKSILTSIDDLVGILDIQRKGNSEEMNQLYKSTLKMERKILNLKNENEEMFNSHKPLLSTIYPVQYRIISIRDGCVGCPMTAEIRKSKIKTHKKH